MSVIQNKFSSRDTLSEDHKSLSTKNDQYETNCAPFDNNNIPREEPYYIQKKESKPTFLFWALVVFLFTLAVGNLMLTFVILGVLRMGQGMESLELISEENFIKLYGNIDLDIIYKKDGHIESFGDVPMEITGDADSVIMRISRFGELAPSIDIGEDRVTSMVDSFIVKHPQTGEPIFHTEFPNFGLPGGVNKLYLQKAQTKRIVSPIDSNLVIKSDSFIKLTGSEGTRMDGKVVVWTADQDIFLKSLNMSIILSGIEGVYVDRKDLPTTQSMRGGKAHSQYKICVCMPTGKLFRVPIEENSSCHLVGVETSQHPCL